MEPATPHSHDDPYDISTQAARTTGVLIAPVSVDEVVSVVAELTRGLRQPRLVNLSTAGAEFNRRMNLKTWGMRITLRFRPLQSDQTLIWAGCQPKVRSPISDWGQGRSDLLALLTAIDNVTSPDGQGGEVP
jgi:hypothetical protein